MRGPVVRAWDPPVWWFILGQVLWLVMGGVIASTSNWPSGVAALIVGGGALFGLFTMGPRRLELAETIITVRTVRGLQTFDLREATSISYGGAWSLDSGEMVIHFPGRRSVFISARGPDLNAFMRAVVATGDALGLSEKVLDSSLDELRRSGQLSGDLASTSKRRPLMPLIVGGVRVQSATDRAAWEPEQVWFLRKQGSDSRNVLFGAALEFGENWRRDVSVLATERLRGLDADVRESLAKEIEDARNSIEEWVLSRWNAVHGKWSRDDAAAAEAHIRATYPWMDERNVAHAINQSTYYAWHG